MHIIENDGRAISRTNYWDSAHAAKGYTFLSWNAGAGRVMPATTCPVLDLASGRLHAHLRQGKKYLSVEGHRGESGILVNEVVQPRHREEQVFPSVAIAVAAIEQHQLVAGDGAL